MEPDLLIALRLAADGYGTPKQIMEMPVDLVMAALEYVTFKATFEETAYEMNRKTE